MFESPNFRGCEQKNFHSLKIFVFFKVLWYGRSCKEMCGAILWIGQQGRRNKSTKYPLPASMTTTTKKKKWNLLENCHKYAPKLFRNALYLARIGRPDILWSSEQTCTINHQMDQSLWQTPWIDWFHIFTTHKKKQFCHVGTSAKQCRLKLFQDSDFAGDLEDSKSTSGGTLCIFGSHTFFP